MATPITAIQKESKSEEQIKLEKLDELKVLLAENDEAVSKTMKLLGELNGLGVFDAADSMLQAKEDIAKIALGQLSREPVVNLLNSAIAAGTPCQIRSRINGKAYRKSHGRRGTRTKLFKRGSKITIFQLLKAINDPDINRAVGFGLHFLKGMGKALKD